MNVTFWISASIIHQGKAAMASDMHRRMADMAKDPSHVYTYTCTSQLASRSHAFSLARYDLRMRTRGKHYTRAVKKQLATVLCVGYRARGTLP